MYVYRYGKNKWTSDLIENGIPIVMQDADPMVNEILGNLVGM